MAYGMHRIVYSRRRGGVGCDIASSRFPLAVEGNGCGIRGHVHNTSTLEGVGGTPKADERTDKLREFDGEKGEG